MVNSGIPWIGDIPKEWKVCQVKNLFTISRGRVIPITDMDDSFKYPVYSSQTKDNGCMGYISTFDYKEEALTWTTDGANAGTVFYRNGKFNCTNVCGVLQLKDKCSFIKYMLYSVGLSAFNSRRADTNGYKIMSNEMAEIQIIVPHLVEQQKIASFLDKKCAEIEEMITLQEKIIDELKAYKQSVITEAVTKGLNPNVPMKESGIEWIGQIPAHWEVCRLKNVLRLKTGTTPSGYDVIADGDRISWFTPSDISDECNELYSSERTLLKSVVKEVELFPVGSIMFVGIGASAGKLGYAQIEGYSNQQITALIPSSVNGKFFYYFLIADKKRLKDNAFFTTLPIINNGYLSQNKVLCPPSSIQNEVVHYLDTKCTEIDNLISIKQQKIENLKEYKKSIIYEYVTGKKEVED